MKKNPDYEGNSDEEILEKIQMEKNSDGENSANSVYVFVLNLRQTHKHSLCSLHSLLI